MKKCFILILVFVLFGCLNKPGIQPKDWYNFDQMKNDMKSGDFRKLIDDAVDRKDYVEAARLRNITIAKVVAGINAAWSESRSSILVGNATLNTIADVTQVAISALGSYLTDADVLRRLAMSSAILGGSYSAYNKNFLQGQGIILLVEKMETLRAAQLKLIQDSYAKEYDLCPYDTMMDYCAKLFDYGTATGAWLTINQKD